MFPLHAVLVGLSEQLAPQVRQELASLSATVDAEYRGADSLIEGLRESRAEKRVLIAQFDRAQDADWLRRLLEVFSGWPIVALVEVAQDPENLMRANRAGATQILSLPLRAEDFGAALNCIALQFGSQLRSSQVIAISGSAAGAGTTTVAINLAYEIATQYQRRTILVELAHQMGVLATNLDVEPTLTLVDLLTNPEQLDAQLIRQALVRVADNFDILPGSRGVGQAMPVAGVLRVLDYVKNLAEFVILDVPCSYNEFQFEVLGAASRVVLLGEQTIASVRTLKLILDSLKLVTGPQLLYVVLNRYDPSMTGLTVGDLEKLLQVPNIRTIPDDHRGIRSAVNQGKALRQVDSNSPVLAAVNLLAQDLIGKPPAPSGLHLVRRLFDFFRK